MPVKGEVPWACQAHTAAKHDIYRRYLARWFPILLAGANAYPSVTYAEGFAGPGIYSGGEPGSPVIATARPGCRCTAGSPTPRRGCT